MSRPVFRNLSLISLATSWLYAGTALAQPIAISPDNFTFRAGITFQHDDNFFRSTAASAVSELITTQTAGVNFSIPVSLQRFELDVGLTNNLHRDNSSFDYLGKDYRAAWLWSFTPQWHGTLSSSRADTLNAPADSVTSTLRNKNSTTTHVANAVYEFGGPWQFQGGYTRSTSLNERPLVGDANEHSSTYNAGVRYALSSGSSVAYDLRRQQGESTSAFSGVTHDFRGVWAVSPLTTLTGNVAYLNRDYGLTPQFNYSGVSGGISATWQATGKITVNAGWRRDLESYQSTGSTHTQTDTLTFGPVWQISPITSLSAQYLCAIRRDAGSPSGFNSGRKDNTQETSLTYSWAPQPFVSLRASLAHARRSSNVAGQGYSDNLATVSAQFSF